MTKIAPPLMRAMIVVPLLCGVAQAGQAGADADADAANAHLCLRTRQRQ